MAIYFLSSARYVWTVWGLQSRKEWMNKLYTIKSKRVLHPKLNPECPKSIANEDSIPWSLILNHTGSAIWNPFTCVSYLSLSLNFLPHLALECASAIISIKWFGKKAPLRGWVAVSVLFCLLRRLWCCVQGPASPSEMQMTLLVLIPSPAWAE